MLLLHLGIPPSGHGYAPPIAVAIITVLAKKGLYSAEMHLRVYYSSAPSLSKKLSVNGEKTVLASQSAQRKHDTSPAHPNFPRKRPPHSHRRNEAANWSSTFFFSFFTNPEFPFQKPVMASLVIGLEPSSLPPVPAYFFTKRKGRKSVLNIRGWIPSLLFLVELVMFLTMFPFIKEIRLFVPAHGAVNQTGNVFF